MIFWKILDGVVWVTMTSADPAGTLQVLNRADIPLHQVEWVDELTVRFQCSRRCKDRLKQICSRRGDKVIFSRESGVKSAAWKLGKRPMLLAGLLLFFALTMYLPTRVLFFQVEGNQRVPGRLILDTAAECGICFGASRRQVRSEKMKNALLEAMPELKWAGINTSGCTATISVRERAMEEEPTAANSFGSIVAVRDAYITEVTVTRGNALCAPGQVVKAGQILISGQTDLGICVQVTQAQGEVFGETIHDFQAITPLGCQIRQTQGREMRRYSLIFGKKRINFGKGSGISPVTCGRIYQEYDLILPGGFRLPLCLGVETLTHWETAAAQIDPEEASMLAFARNQILGSTVAGTILAEDLLFSRTDDLTVLSGRFSIHEMIGRVIKEEIGETHGKTD